VTEAWQRGPGAERRRVPRFEPAELAESVFVVGSRIVNIGAHGLMLEAPVPLAADSPLRFHLVVGEHKDAVDARVRSCVPRSRGRSWGVGVEFEAISEGARGRLERALLSRRSGNA
jgi:hypothetical protein